MIPMHLGHPHLQHRPSPRHLRWLYVLSGLLLASGVGWLTGRYGLRASGPYGEVPHPSEVWWLRLHGAAAMGLLIAFGALLPGHVAHNWRRRIHYRTGLFLVVSVAWLALTGYGLYYLVSDRLRSLISVAHWGVGLSSVFALVAHVVLSYRRAARRRTDIVRHRRPQTTS
jgi:hypothetical protein